MKDRKLKVQSGGSLNDWDLSSVVILPARRKAMNC